MSSILDTLLARVVGVQTGLQSGALVREVLLPREQDILDAQRLQLLAGKDSGGEDIHPFYSEDLKPEGYFYSVESAGRYSAWKQDLTYPYSVERNPDAPNLYITGRFHDEIGVEFGPDTLGIVGETAYAQSIMAKYGIDTFGLNYEGWESIWESGSYEQLIFNIESLLYASY